MSLLFVRPVVERLHLVIFTARLRKKHAAKARPVPRLDTSRDIGRSPDFAEKVVPAGAAVFIKPLLRYIFEAGGFRRP